MNKLVITVHIYNIIKMILFIYLTVDNIIFNSQLIISQVGHLAMETLLSLTSKRAGEWFKEELRNLGGVDHIVRTIQDCVARLEPPAAAWTSAEVDVLRKADRCMRVLENVGFNLTLVVLKMYTTFFFMTILGTGS